MITFLFSDGLKMHVVKKHTAHEAGAHHEIGPSGASNAPGSRWLPLELCASRPWLARRLSDNLSRPCCPFNLPADVTHLDCLSRMYG
jgi:hypothetical protein